MMLKVGELAKRSGLTVRALHHYDSIGLLTPSARSDSGYRLYNSDDIARLHQIQALRRFGVALADIAAFLASPGSQLQAIVGQQIAALTRQIDQAALLREQLAVLQRQIAAGEEPDLSTWLSTLELMTMYDKYFTKDELARLPLFQQEATGESEWPLLVARVRALMDGGTPPSDPQAQQLGQQWMSKIERDTAGNPDFFARLNAMHEHEPSVQQRTGITRPMIDYVVSAVSESRLAIYQRYLSPDEFAFMRANIGKRAHEWPPLIAAVRAQMTAGAAPTDPAVRQLALTWLELFRSHAGDKPETHMKIRTAHAREPGLLTGTWVTPDMIAFIGQAMAALKPA
jgi:DNA-binding transcriptional MerR regulator